MNECACGEARRQFWIWEDAGGTLHASNFQPSSGAVRAVYAVTARDALLPIVERRAPRHQVHDVHEAGVGWEGRCASTLATAAN